MMSKAHCQFVHCLCAIGLHFSLKPVLGNKTPPGPELYSFTRQELGLMTFCYSDVPWRDFRKVQVCLCNTVLQSPRLRQQRFCNLNKQSDPRQGSALPELIVPAGRWNTVWILDVVLYSALMMADPVISAETRDPSM